MCLYRSVPPNPKLVADMAMLLGLCAGPGPFGKIMFNIPKVYLPDLAQGQQSPIGSMAMSSGMQFFQKLKQKFGDDESKGDIMNPKFTFSCNAGIFDKWATAELLKAQSKYVPVPIPDLWKQNKAPFDPDTPPKAKEGFPVGTMAMQQYQDLLEANTEAIISSQNDPLFAYDVDAAMAVGATMLVLVLCCALCLCVNVIIGYGCYNLRKKAKIQSSEHTHVVTCV